MVRRFIVLLAVFFAFLFYSNSILASNIGATTQTWAWVANYLMGESTFVQSITKSGRDPHEFEPLPSDLVLLKSKTTLIMSGLGLENEWLPKATRSIPLELIDASSSIQAILDNNTQSNKSMGTHKKGNPHYYLDPLALLSASEDISKKLILIFPERKTKIEKNTADLKTKITARMVGWKNKLSQLKNKTVAENHPNLIYFFRRFEIESVGSIESHPGVAPTPKSIVTLIESMKHKNTKCILGSVFYKNFSYDKVLKATHSKLVLVPTEVLAEPKVLTYFDLIDEIVTRIVACNN